MQLTNYSRKKNFFTTQGAPCVQTKIFILEYFFRCILSLRQVYIFEIYIKFCIFWYPWSPYCENKILDLYIYCIVHDPKCFDQWWSGHWVKILFSFIFGTFEGNVTDLRDTFVLVPISTHPNIHTVYCIYIEHIFWCITKIVYCLSRYRLQYRRLCVLYILKFKWTNEDFSCFFNPNRSWGNLHNPPKLWEYMF
jgi:hypothetical protein